MKEYNLYNKIKELQDIDKDISEAEKERENISVSKHYSIFLNEDARKGDLMQSDRLLSTLHSIRKEYLLQISLIAKMESEKINSELCSN